MPGRQYQEEPDNTIEVLKDLLSLAETNEKLRREIVAQKYENSECHRVLEEFVSLLRDVETTIKDCKMNIPFISPEILDPLDALHLKISNRIRRWVR